MKLRVSAAVLKEAQAFMNERGLEKREGTAMIAGRYSDGIAYGQRLVIPDQRGEPAPRCWVEVTPKGKLELAAALNLDEVYVARIHSHPDEAFHSITDDSNPFLGAEGAFSIVVPDFGDGLAIGLRACAIHERRSGRWTRLSDAEVTDRIDVVLTDG